MAQVKYSLESCGRSEFALFLLRVGKVPTPWANWRLPDSERLKWQPPPVRVAETAVATIMGLTALLNFIIPMSKLLWEIAFRRP